ncbi:MAG: hypothetical protein K6F80_07435 [Oscillospiraceae bacterium]|nr:hypothetical protein [Oscillospiraceae bacterium]
MKRFKRTAALCLSIVLAAASVPVSAVQADPGVSDETTISETAGLPASYDLRSKGLVTEVGDEMQYNTSWAFAAADSMESSLLKTDPNANISEWNMAYCMFSNNFGYKYDKDVPFNEDIQDFDQITGLLASWLGSTNSYTSYSYGDVSIMDWNISAAQMRSGADFHVTDAVSYPYQPYDYDDNFLQESLSKQINAVKERIYADHALAMRVLYSASCYDAEKYTYCYDFETWNTADAEAMPDWRYMTIVGWDDSIPAASFKSNPPMDGAWLCKCSSGTAYGDNGYIWVSYADATINGITEYRAESANLNNRLYQHDEYGWNGAYLVNEEEPEKEIMIANVFTAEENGWLTGIMFYNMYSGDTFDATVYTGLTSNDNPVSGTAAGAKKVVLDETGYLTIELDEPVFLKKGDSFSVTAKVSGEAAGARIPCEYASRSISTGSNGTKEVFDSTFTMDMLESSLRTGQSFYSTDGSVWVDMYNVEPEKWSAAVDNPIEYDPESGDTVNVTDALETESSSTAAQIPTFIPPTDAGEAVPSATETETVPMLLPTAEQATALPEATPADTDLPMPMETRYDATEPPVISVEEAAYAMAEGDMTEDPTETASADAAAPAESSEEVGTIDGSQFDVISRCGNICLKAVTRDCGTVVFSNNSTVMKKGESIHLSCDDQAPIYYTLDGVNWELYDDEKPITMPEGEDLMILSAYVDLSIISLSDDKHIMTQAYATETASVSSLLCKTDKDAVSRYADHNPDETDVNNPNYVYYLPKGSKTVSLTPISTGSITIGGKPCKSGETITLDLAGYTESIPMTVTEEGKESVECALYLEELPDSDVVETTPQNPTESDTGSQETPGDGYILGDVNGDGKVDSRDGTQILIAAAHIGSGDPTGGLTEVQRKAADVNGDSKTNAADATAVFRYAAAYANDSTVKIADFI